MCSIITKEEEDELEITKEELLEFYKSDKINFCNHTLMDIAINVFIMIINLG